MILSGSFEFELLSTADGEPSRSTHRYTRLRTQDWKQVTCAHNDNTTAKYSRHDTSRVVLSCTCKFHVEIQSFGSGCLRVEAYIAASTRAFRTKIKKIAPVSGRNSLHVVSHQ